MLLASQFDQAKYFKADDLATDIKLRIREATEEVVGPKQERKLVVWFTNSKKGLILNRTNNRTIRGAYGDPVEGWQGKLVVLFASETEMSGRTVPCVRVRIPTPVSTDAQTVKPAAQHDDVPPATKAAKPQVDNTASATKTAKPPADEIDDEVAF